MENKNVMNKWIFFFICLLFIFAFIFSFNSVMSLLKYSVLVQHDQTIAFNRVFFEPEHGRYLSTFLVSLLTEKIPNLLNIHPNDFHCTLTPVIKSIVVCFICLMFSFSIFLFRKKEKEKKNFLFFTFLVVYVTVFLALFNDGYFSFLPSHYLHVFENMVFFEYPFSFLFYIPFMLIFFYYNNKNSCYEIPKNIYILWCIITFLLGLTVELIILPVLFFMVSMVLYYLLKYIKDKTLQKKKSLTNVCGVFCVYIISLLVYFASGNDFASVYEGGFYNYINNEFSNFWSIFFGFYILDEKTLFIIFGVLFVLTLFFGQKKLDKNLEFLMFVALNILGVILYVFSSFLLGKETEVNSFFFVNSKWTLMYRTIIIFYLLLTCGYFINVNSFLQKKADVVISFLAVFVLFMFSESLIFNYLPNIKKESDSMKDLRKVIYMAEKTALYSSIDKIQMPQKDYEKCYFYDSCYIDYFLNVQKDRLNNKKFVEFVENYEYDENLFTESELENLRFSDL